MTTYPLTPYGRTLCLLSDKELKQEIIMPPNSDQPAGMTYDASGKIYVYVNKGQTTKELIRTCVHEATHVVQHLQDSASAEFDYETQAYWNEMVTSALMDHYIDGYKNNKLFKKETK